MCAFPSQIANRLINPRVIQNGLLPSHPSQDRPGSLSASLQSPPPLPQNVRQRAYILCFAALTLGGAILAITGAALPGTFLIAMSGLAIHGATRQLQKNRVKNLLDLQTLQTGLNEKLTSGESVRQVLSAFNRLDTLMKQVTRPTAWWQLSDSWTTRSWILRLGILGIAIALSPALGSLCACLHMLIASVQALLLDNRHSLEKQAGSHLKRQLHNQRIYFPGEPNLDALLRLRNNPIELQACGPALIQKATGTSRIESQGLWQQLRDLRSSDLQLAKTCEKHAKNEFIGLFLADYCTSLSKTPLNHFLQILSGLVGENLPKLRLSELLRALPRGSPTVHLEPLRRWLAAQGPALTHQLSLQSHPRQHALEAVPELHALQKFLDGANPSLHEQMQRLGVENWPVHSAENLLAVYPDILTEVSQNSVKSILEIPQISLNDFIRHLQELPTALQDHLLMTALEDRFEEDPGASFIRLLLGNERHAALETIANLSEEAAQPFEHFLKCRIDRSVLNGWQEEILNERHRFTQAFFLAESSEPAISGPENISELRNAVARVKRALQHYLPRQNHNRIEASLDYIPDMRSEDGPVCRKAILNIAQVLTDLEAIPVPPEEQHARIQAGLLQLIDAMSSCSGSWAGNLPQCFETIRGNLGSTSQWLSGKISQERLTIAMRTLTDWVQKNAPREAGHVSSQFSHAMNHVRWLLMQGGGVNNERPQQIALPGAAQARPDWYLNQLAFWPRVIPEIRQAILTAQTPLAIAKMTRDALNAPEARARRIQLRAEIMQQLTDNQDRRIVLAREAQEVLEAIRNQYQQAPPAESPLQELAELPEQSLRLRQELRTHAAAGRQHELQRCSAEINRIQGRLNILQQRERYLHNWLTSGGEDNQEPLEEHLILQLWRLLDAASAPLQNAGFPTAWNTLREMSEEHPESIRIIVSKLSQWGRTAPSVWSDIRRLLHINTDEGPPTQLLERLSQQRQLAEAEADMGPLFPNELCSLSGAFTVLQHLNFVSEAAIE